MQSIGWQEAEKEKFYFSLFVPRRMRKDPEYGGDDMEGL